MFIWLFSSNAIFCFARSSSPSKYNFRYYQEKHNQILSRNRIQKNQINVYLVHPKYHSCSTTAMSSKSILSSGAAELCRVFGCTRQYSQTDRNRTDGISFSWSVHLAWRGVTGVHDTYWYHFEQNRYKFGEFIASCLKTHK